MDRARVATSSASISQGIRTSTRYTIPDIIPAMPTPKVISSPTNIHKKVLAVYS